MKILGMICGVFVTINVMGSENVNLVSNPCFDEGTKGWNVWKATIDDTVSMGGTGKSLYFNYTNQDAGSQQIAYQDVVLNQKNAQPFVYRCSSKAQDLPLDVAPSHAYYGIELCIKFQDGSTKWISPKKCFSTGTHDWESIEDTYSPPKPVETVRFYCRLKITGKVWFDNFFLHTEKKN